tara:strand:- start:29 stop:337 length:309 start_codon:yes stop_codon:yes gene_type:complete
LGEWELVKELTEGLGRDLSSLESTTLLSQEFVIDVLELALEVTFRSRASPEWTAEHLFLAFSFFSLVETFWSLTPKPSHIAKFGLTSESFAAYEFSKRIRSH